MNSIRISSIGKRMKRKLLVGQTLLLALMSLVSSEKATESLHCYSDFIDVISCVWNRSSVEDRFLITSTTNCSLQGEHKSFSDTEIHRSDLVPVGSLQQTLSKATLKFSPQALNYALDVQLDVFCGNMPEPVDNIQLNPSLNIKLYPPEKPVVKGENVTWKLGSPVPKYINKWLFEVQWRHRKSSWKKENVLQVETEHCKLDENGLLLGEEYVIRVRSTRFRSSMIWSEWSNLTEWTSTVGKPPSTATPGVLSEVFLDSYTGLVSIVLLIAGVIFLMVSFSTHFFRSFLKSLFTPKPSEYFKDLYADHGGDIKSWLGPLVIPVVQFNPELEEVSPVKVYEDLNLDLLAGKPEKRDNLSDKSDSTASCFSNSTYFLSQSSKCAMSDQLQPCSTECPYGPAGGAGKQEKSSLVSHNNEDDPESNVSTPMEMSPSFDDLHKLRMDVQSPDSGFANGTDDQESHDESGSEGLPSPPVMDNVLPMNCLLQCPVPQLSGLAHSLLPLSCAWSPWNNLSFPNLPPGISTNVQIGTSKLLACSGMLEPSNDDYMPVKNE